MTNEVKTVSYTKKSAKVLSLALMLIFIISSLSMASAINGGAGAKALNLHGYKIDLNTSTGAVDSLEIYFDKNISSYFDSGMIKITDTSSGSPISFTTAVGSGGGWTHTGNSGGTTVTITPNSGTPIANEDRYTVSVSGCTRANNTYATCIGTYIAHNDTTFYVDTPDTSGSYKDGSNNYYSGTPQIVYIPSGSSNVGESLNPTVVCSVPWTVYDSTLTASYIESNVYLQKYVGSTWTTMNTDNTFTAHTKLSGVEGYVTQVNDAGNTMFVPLTLGGTTSASYDMEASYTYRIYCSGILNSSFTVYANPESMGGITPSVTASTSSTITLSWNNITSGGTTGQLPASYIVYVSTNQYFGFTTTGLSNNTITNSGSTSQLTVTISSPLTTGVLYYFRVAPVYSSHEGGFSMAVSHTFS